MKKRLLLLNPPGSRTYLREYYCSKIPKVPYFYYPIDLYYLSGRLAGEFDLHVLDCITERVGRDECLKRIDSLDPDIVVSIVGHVSWEEDSKLFEILSRKKERKIVAGGDVLLDPSGRLFTGTPQIDAVILDFTSDDILHFLREDYDKIRFMHYRRDGEAHLCNAKRETGAEMSVPLPLLDAFPYKKYHFPFARRHPYGVILTDFGCPFSCGFCAINTLGYKCRALDNVFDELDMLKRAGLREILFADQTFGAVPRRAELILNEMVQRKYGFGFSCWTRADLVTADFAALLRRAGCHTIMLGAESANATTLTAQSKGLTPETVEKGVRTAKEAGLRVLATFILGLPGESRADCVKTINFALSLNPDYASFNVAVPRSGTKIRDQAIAQGWIGADYDVMDQSGFAASMRSGSMSEQEISEVKSLAERKFYFRLSYILKRLMLVRTGYEFRSLFSLGAFMIRQVLARRRQV